MKKIFLILLGLIFAVSLSFGQRIFSVEMNQNREYNALMEKLTQEIWMYNVISITIFYTDGYESTIVRTDNSRDLSNFYQAISIILDQDLVMMRYPYKIYLEGAGTIYLDNIAIRNNFGTLFFGINYNYNKYKHFYNNRYYDRYFFIYQNNHTRYRYRRNNLFRHHRFQIIRNKPIIMNNRTQQPRIQRYNKPINRIETNPREFNLRNQSTRSSNRTQNNVSNRSNQTNRNSINKSNQKNFARDKNIRTRIQTNRSTPQQSTSQRSTKQSSNRTKR